MRKLIFLFLVIFSRQQENVFSQSITTASSISMLKREQNEFLRQLGSASIDKNITRRLSRFIETETDSIHRVILADNSIPDSVKIKAINSLVYFMEGIRESLKKQKPEIYNIPAALEFYKQFLRSFIYNTPVSSLTESLNHHSSLLLAIAFRHFKEHRWLEDITVYKRVVSAPEHILSFLELNPGFRFADSLLFYAAAQDPLKIANYLRRKNTPLTGIIRKNKNIYLQQIVLLSDSRDASELLPFVAPLAENKITTEEILKKRTDVTQYFQLLVNTLKDYLAATGGSDGFHNALRYGIKEKSYLFYVSPINELHNSPEHIRFAPVKDLRPEDLYYIITSSEEELYTSSYLGLYRRLMEFCKRQSADSLFGIVGYDGFRKFIRMAANYNTLSDFFSCLPREMSRDLMTRFVSGIEIDTWGGLEKAMDIADCFTGLADDPEFSTLVENELQRNRVRCQAQQNIFGTRLYGILLQVFGMVMQKDASNKLRDQLGNYEKLDRDELLDKKGEIVQQVLFYGDEDGVSSFNNFLGLFKDSLQWEVSKSNLWVTIRSVSDPPIIIYANLPLDEKEELDLRAQDTLSAFLKEQLIEPAILIHRGHSYHLQKTLKRMQPSVKLAILGSCGGYNNILSVANISPGAQIIVSKQVGSKFINDPMLDVINNNLKNKNEIIWTQVWAELAERFKKDPFVLNLFNEYIPPSKNISLFVLKIFNSPIQGN